MVEVMLVTTQRDGILPPAALSGPYLRGSRRKGRHAPCISSGVPVDVCRRPADVGHRRTCRRVHAIRLVLGAPFSLEMAEPLRRLRSLSAANAIFACILLQSYGEGHMGVRVLTATLGVGGAIASVCRPLFLRFHMVPMLQGYAAAYVTRYLARNLYRSMGLSQPTKLVPGMMTRRVPTGRVRGGARAQPLALGMVALHRWSHRVLRLTQWPAASRWGRRHSSSITATASASIDRARNRWARPPSLRSPRRSRTLPPSPLRRRQAA